MKTELIIALDFSENSDAVNMVKRISDAGRFYKVGLELFISCGGRLIPTLKDMGKKVFLDLKLHDIPNTVRGALLASLKYGADIVNVHIQGGREMLKLCSDTCKEYAIKSGFSPKIIGVTLLTSLSEDYLREYGISAASPKEYVIKLAKFAKDAGLDGVVSSAQESREIKEACGGSFIIISPGIRFNDGSLDDQQRASAPQFAARNGVDYIVVGRPITHSHDPAWETERFYSALRQTV
ncbi:MAG: orotidine-5'-phosphate decarboxylase [Deferribacteraceae bacterium]|jgi:orotidine-5'-phosphate decarboxylase|nr:orotidine-5'-phosphate decarboxylase [Deferribacteraceae bacterium]